MMVNKIEKQNNFFYGVKKWSNQNKDYIKAFTLTDIALCSGVATMDYFSKRKELKNISGATPNQTALNYAIKRFAKWLPLAFLLSILSIAFISSNRAIDKSRPEFNKTKENFEKELS